MADAPANEGLSTSSSRSNDNIEESALQHLNVDNDHDSAFFEMTPQPSTTSITSSVYNFVEENGRTYHRYKEGKYMLPNDEAEKYRLDLQHQLWLITLFDELNLAPVKNLHNVLDFGTGTGVWAIEFANKHPTAQVVGSDLSPIQPDYVPSNCRFEVDDAEDEWNYSQKFDLIHGRAMVTCFKDPGEVIKQAFQSLTPGGYLELQDMILPMRAIDDSLNGTVIDHWTKLTMESAAKLGTSWKNSANYVRYYEEAGFVDIQEKYFQWPSNTWPKGERMKTLGSYWQEDMLRGLEALSMAVLTRGAGMSKEEVLAMTAEVKKDIHNTDIHAYLPVVVVYGRRPE